jgi:phenylpyruvate tautomerase PptA (4-oxalocrotonate tautomerase family)
VPPTTKPDTFESEFLTHYLAQGIGGMTKKDIDALAMYLLDKYGVPGTGPLYKFPNQETSVLLKATVSKIKQLRYEAGLKYGGRVEDKALARLLAALNAAVLDVDSKKIHLIVEDVLAKNWLQGQLKQHGLVFDHSFNAEILKVDAKGLFKLLDRFFDRKLTERFREQFEKATKEQKAEKLKESFARLAKDFAGEAAKKAGSAVAAYFGLYVPG